MLTHRRYTDIAFAAICDAEVRSVTRAARPHRGRWARLLRRLGIEGGPR